MPSTAVPADKPAAAPALDRRRLAWGMGLLVLIYLVIVYVLPRPAAIEPAGWRLFGLFAATIVGLIAQPMPGGALVLLAVTLSSVIGGLTIQQALAGYADPTVWLVLAAFFISRALINTGLARRIALLFVRRFGHSSLGVSYALAASDTVLATIIPSSGARSGGVILPIVRSIAELYGSRPGVTAPLLGSFLMVAVYQAVCVSSAMFYTGQASNALAANIASEQFGYPLTVWGWMVAGSVPGLCSLAVIPWVVMRLYPPTVQRTPEAAAFAARELAAQGRMSRDEWILSLVFAAVCSLWITSDWNGLDVAVAALFGSVALLLTGVLSWEDVKAERSAWDIFIWYGGLLRLGKALNDAGVTTEFAKAIGAALAGTTWVVLFAVALGLYFYTHYGFASITAHILAMYPPFLAVLVARGAPLGLMVFGFATFTNLSAGLTHYGTTPAPMFYAQEYVPFGTWWRIGFVCSLVNIAIWSTVGFAWWKFLGIW